MGRTDDLPGVVGPMPPTHRHRIHGPTEVTAPQDTSQQAIKPLPGWRTGDLSFRALALGYLLLAIAVLALAASGSWVGMAGAGLVTAGEIALVIVWSGAPNAGQFARSSRRPGLPRGAKRSHRTTGSGADAPDDPTRGGSSPT